MGGAEVIAGERMGSGRLKLLIRAPGSAENGNRGIFFSVVMFPSAASAQIPSFWEYFKSDFKTGTPAGCWCGNCCQGAVLNCFYGRE